MGVACREGFRVCERNSHETKEVVEPGGRDGGCGGDLADGHVGRHRRVDQSRHDRVHVDAVRV